MKERFSTGSFKKLKPKAGHPFKIVKNINDNAHKIELSKDYNIFATFNIVDLSSYFEDLAVLGEEGEASPIGENNERIFQG